MMVTQMGGTDLTVCERKRVNGVRRSGSAALMAAVALSLGIGAAPAVARLAPIIGKLSRSGYTVIVLGYNGKAALAKGPVFRVAAPDRLVTLQLRDAHGKYAGPVVVGGKGAKVYEGVKAGAKLGTIKVLRGYAKVTGKVAALFLDKKRWAHARNGVPLGNGLNYGLVRIHDHSGSRTAGGDRAHSGVPNDISIDADADGIIDALKPSGLVRAHLAQSAPPTSSFGMFSQLLPGGLEDTVNADASTISTAEIDATMVSWSSLYMQVVPGDVTQLDCGGLTFCAPGGTGHLLSFGGSGIQPISSNYLEGPAFPACCDVGHGGLGNLVGPGAPALQPGPNPPSTSALALYPEATSAQIGSGDVLIQNVTKAGVTTQIPGTINFAFNTTPALMRWSSGSDSATVSYPVDPGAPVTPGPPGGPPGSGAPGTQSNPWPIGGGAGDVVLTLTFWRPQRSGIAGAGEPAFMDVGHLAYSSNPYVLSRSGTQPLTCPASSYSKRDPHLVPNPDTHVNGFVDQANDAPASPANTLTYSLDLTACFAANGATLSSSDEVKDDIFARTAMSASGLSDTTGQTFAFKLR